MPNVPVRPVLLLACALVASVSEASPRRVLPVAEADRARLGVVLVVDQLAQAHLDKWGDLLRDDGLRRLLSGASALDARYLAAPTATAHGHASLATGTYAARHGVVSNDWFDRALGRVVYAAHDPDSSLLPAGTPGDGASSKQLLAPSIGDALRLAHADAKVVSLAVKSRGAVFFAGGRPNAVVWFGRAGRWVSSTAYARAMPAWVPEAAPLPSAVTWDRLAEPRLCALLPSALRPKAAPDCARVLAERRAGRDDDALESDPASLGRTFPHPLPAADRAERAEGLLHTPLLDEALLELAIQSIKGESLGSDTTPDLLTVSLGAFDFIGHAYGPDSHEALDALLRLDAGVARFLAFLDSHVGAGRYVVVLSADHGIRPAPALLSRHGLPAGTFDGPALANRVEAALDAALGPRDWVGGYATAGLSFRAEAFVDADRPRIEAIAVAEALKTPGIAAAWPRSTFASLSPLRGDAAAFARSWLDGRSPDLVLHLRPGFHDAGDVAAHGTPYLAEVRVPLAFFRGGRAGFAIDGPIDVTTLAPTLALVLGVAPPFASEAPILGAVVEALR